MAKRSNDHPAQKPNGNLRVRWVEVEVSGSDTTIEEALRTVERMRRPVIDTPSNHYNNHQASIPSTGDVAASKVPVDSAGLNEVQPDLFEGTSNVDSPIEPSIESSPPRKKRGDGERIDRNAGIDLIGDIDFVPNDHQSLKEFFADKNPGSDIDQVLVLCYFLQHMLKLETIGPGHILSGFKHVGKPVPKDLKQTIRNIRRNKAWIGFSDIKNIRLTTEGDNRVEHELGKTNSAEGSK